MQPRHHLDAGDNLPGFFIIALKYTVIIFYDLPYQRTAYTFYVIFFLDRFSIDLIEIR
jgi:hypothetical protein